MSLNQHSTNCHSLNRRVTCRVYCESGSNDNDIYLVENNSKRQAYFLAVALDTKSNDLIQETSQADDFYGLSVFRCQFHAKKNFLLLPYFGHDINSKRFCSLTTTAFWGSWTLIIETVCTEHRRLLWTFSVYILLFRVLAKKNETIFATLQRPEEKYAATVCKIVVQRMVFFLSTQCRLQSAENAFVVIEKRWEKETARHEKLCPKSLILLTEFLHADRRLRPLLLLYYISGRWSRTQVFCTRIKKSREYVTAT